MQLTPLLSLYAVVTGLFAVALLIVPSQLMSVYGAAPLDTLQTILSRFIGSLFAGLAVMAWTARASEAGKAREAIVLGLTILNGLSAVVAVLRHCRGVQCAGVGAGGALRPIHGVLRHRRSREHVTEGWRVLGRCEPPNKRLKLTARVDCGMNLSLARRSLSALR